MSNNSSLNIISTVAVARGDIEMGKKLRHRRAASVPSRAGKIIPSLKLVRYRALGPRKISEKTSTRRALSITQKNEYRPLMPKSPECSSTARRYNFSEIRMSSGIRKITTSVIYLRYSSSDVPWQAIILRKAARLTSRASHKRACSSVYSRRQ